MNRKYALIFLITGILLAGCLGGQEAAPTVSFAAPPNGTNLPAGDSIDIAVTSAEPNGVGIARVELFVNGALFKTEASPSGAEPAFNVAIPWTPPNPGGYNIMAVAYAADDTASQPATLTLDAGGPRQGAANEGGDDGGNAGGNDAGGSSDDGGGGSAASPTQDTSGPVQGKITGAANVRVKPGVYCDLIGQLSEGTTINLLRYSQNRQWAETDALGSIGWVWLDNVQILGNANAIPDSNEGGCEGCGDGTCNNGETCNTCPDDCGVCCGNGVCEPGFGENCNACESDCGPCCGNGVCETEYGENMVNCVADCGVVIAPWCGDGICNGDETMLSCFADCGVVILPWCGDGICNGDETYFTCSEDCPVIVVTISP